MKIPNNKYTNSFFFLDIKKAKFFITLMKMVTNRDDLEFVCYLISSMINSKKNIVNYNCLLNMFCILF